jgi:hypothetical protein
MHLQNNALPTLKGYFELRSFAMSGSPRRFAARDDVRMCYAKPSLFEKRNYENVDFVIRGNNFFSTQCRYGLESG